VIKGGLVTTRSLAIDTSVANIGGEGTIDLGSETIDLALVANPKGVAVPGGQTGISIGGTLAEPQIRVNPALLAARGLAGATLGLFLSPLTRLASQLDLGRQLEAGPCAAMADQAPTDGRGR
jgi:hypothetical protein